MFEPATFWIGYTTLYREGGAKFRRVAETMARELAARHPRARVVCEAVESKRDFVDAMDRIASRGEHLAELHFIGHSGMYGPMFRTTKMPEQFSPHEWRTLRIPFSPDASAYFHCCRSGRFFARSFARMFGVRTYGYFNYTTISRRPDRFVWDARARRDAPLFVVALPGKKSHGVLGSMAKYSHVWPTEKMVGFDPPAIREDASYDPVAALYDEAFQDIRVRGPEIAWIHAHLPPGKPRVLEIGTGNGALMANLADRIARGLGVDASAAMVDLGRARFGHHSNLQFAAIRGPHLPVEDGSVDVVVSLLSWRYLDWDPIMAEVRRVLAPSGKLLVVDMVERPATLRDVPGIVRSKVREIRGYKAFPEFRARLQRLVSDPRWKTMLQYNPIRAEHEYRWYFESRFPGRTVEILTKGYRSRVLAFDTGPLERGFTLPQSYP